MALFCKLKDLQGNRLVIDSPKLVVQVQGTSGSLELVPEILYICGQLDFLSFSLQAVDDEDTTGEYHIFFDSGETPTTISYPDGLLYPKGVQPTIEPNKRYEFNIFNNCLTYEWYE